MSFSPPIRRLSEPSPASRQEDIINAYEAEEERIINVLSRKLEQLREEKIGLENILEAESESHVNKLSRELSALRLAQQQQNGNGHGATNGVASASTASGSASPDTTIGVSSFMTVGPAEPSAEVMLEAMRRENEQLRNRLVDTERDYIRITRLNEIYREELIDHRRRLGLPVDNLIGLSRSDILSQPSHHRSTSSSSSFSHVPSSSPFSNISSSSPSAYHPALHSPPSPISTHHGVPIPRPPSQIHRPINNPSSEGNTPLSHSPSDSSSADSPFPFSPVSGTHPASYLSTNTNLTSLPSSLSFNGNQVAFGVPSRGLSYPSVPPPSLSSSFGSPTVSFHMPHRDASISPVEPLSRRNSTARRGGSVDRGGRVAESGSLLTRSRAGSTAVGITDVAEIAETGDETPSGIMIAAKKVTLGP